MIEPRKALMKKSFPDNGFLTLIGRTPLLKLERIIDRNRFELYAKLEMFNPGSSIKDRTALSIIKRAWERGEIDQNSVIIESSSGNLGIGLAQISNLLGLRFICVVDAKTNRQTIQLLKTYGAEIDMIAKPDPVSGEYLQARIDRVKWLCRKIPYSFWCNQYANLDNPLAHSQLAHEIIKELQPKKVDYIFLAVSTCGTLRGCFEYIKNNNLNTKIIAVDAAGSVIFDSQPGKRLIPGHGAARVPELFQKGMEDKYVHVTDLDCINGCHYLLRKESILVGGSAGGVISAIKKIEKTIPNDSTCVAVLADTGERYLDTIYSEEWVKKSFNNK